MKQILNKIWIGFIIFIVVFCPPIFPGYSISFFACTISFVYVIVKNVDFLVLIKNNDSIKGYIKTTVIFSFYYMLIAFILSIDGNVKVNSHFIPDAWNFVIFLFLAILVSFAITIYCVNKGYTIANLLEILMISVSIECFFVLASFLSPVIKGFLVSLMSSSWIDGHGGEENFLYESTFRNFGLASNLYDIFGYTMSLFALIAFFLYNRAKKGFLYIILFVMILLCGVINARTTAVLVLVDVIVMLVKNKVYLKKLLCWVPVLILLAIFLIPRLFDSSSVQVEWLMTGMTDITQTVKSGKGEGYFDALLNNFLFLPSNILEIIFGAGDTPMIIVKKNSDVGLIQSIWRYGIVGSFIIYGAYTQLILGIKRRGLQYEGLMYAIIVSFFLYQIKLSSLGYSSASIVLLLLCFGITCLKDEKH